jgi:hypothetical protein
MTNSLPHAVFAAHSRGAQMAPFMRKQKIKIAPDSATRVHIGHPAETRTFTRSSPEPNYVSADRLVRLQTKIVDDLDVLNAFYDYRAEHWIHLRTTNPSRPSRPRGCGSGSPRHPAPAPPAWRWPSG